MYANISATIVHISIVMTLTVNLGWGLLGVAIASSVQFFVRYLVTVGYIYVSGKFNDPATQVSFTDPDSMKNWKGQFLLSLQCMSLSVWSWWAMDIFTLIATYMEANVITAQYIMRNIALLTFMIPVGLMVASMILVGNNVGANKVAVGRAYAHLCVRAAAVWAVGTIALLLIFQGPFIGIFTTTPDVQRLILEAFPVMFAYIFFDCIQCVG